ncbi:MAG: SGNH/GDSL hydrolase family protein [Nitriliruptorales bacterium]|nr:SGNH/GDSL hydrolase family protein [Nitriliruptorales bacterium]
MRRALLVFFAVGAGIVIYDVVAVLRLRGGAPDPPGPLDHDGRVGGGAGEPLRLVVLGDSAAAGYGLTDPDAAYPRRLARRLSERTGRPVALTSFAEDGARIADLASTQTARIPRDADVVVLAAGVNDALGRRRPHEVEADTDALIEAVTARVPDAEVVVVGCPDLHTAPGFPWPLDRVVGWSCRRTREAQRRASEGRPVRFVSYPTPPTVDMYGADGFHPGARGQDAAAEAAVASLDLSRVGRQ